MPEAIDFWKLKHETDVLFIRLGWNKDECIAYIQSHYGKRSRLVMTDEQLVHLRDALAVIHSKQITQNLFTPRFKRRRRNRR